MLTPRSDHSQQNLVLLHGMFGNPGQWKACAEGVAGDWRILRPLIPLLKLKPDGGALDEAGDCILREMDAAGMERAVLGGNSLGGHIALRLALRFPARVTAMVLTGSSGLFERSFEKSIPRRPTETYIRTKMREVFHDGAHVTTELVEDVMGVLGDIRRVLHMIRIARCARRDNLRDVLPEIACPVLLIWGENDNVTPLAAGQEFHGLLRHSRFHSLPACGHVPMVEHTDQFNRLVNEFLTDLVSGGSSLPVPFPPVLRQSCIA